MGQYLSFRLIYGVYPTEDAESLFECEDGDHDFVQAIIERRGLPHEVDYTDYPQRTYTADEDWDSRYAAWKNRPDIVAANVAREASQAAVKADYPHLEVEFGGVMDSWSVSILGIEDSGFIAGGAITALDGVPDAPHFIDRAEWDDELRRALEELEVDPDAVSKPGWVAVISYG